MTEKSENLIKQTCKELNLTYKQLGEMIGYGDGAVKNAASSNNISQTMAHAIEMLKRIKELEARLESTERLKTTLKELLEI